MEPLERGSLALVGGRLFTADPARPAATALAVRNGLIAYVGDDPVAARDAAGPRADVIDLAGRTATPGLIDSHVHPLSYGASLENVDLASLRSVEAVLEAIRARAETTPVGQIVTGSGYHPLTIAERRMPTLAELDRVAPDHVVRLIHRSGHEATVNRLALAQAGVGRSTPDPAGGRFERDETGELTGRVIENALSSLGLGIGSGAKDPSALDRHLARATEILLSYGITSATEACLASPEAMRAYARAQRDDARPRLRINLMLDHWSMLEHVEAMGLPGGLGDDWLRSASIKFFLDGAEGQRSAKLSEPYSDDPDTTGMWMFPLEEFHERVRRAHVAGWQCAIHAIGDAAVEVALDTFRDVQRELPREDVRHRIEHATLLRPDLVGRFADEGVIPVPGARFLSGEHPLLRSRFGPERLRWYQPWRTLVELGTPVPVSSDAPVQSADSAKNLWALVNGRSEFDPDLVMVPEELLSLDQALTVYTRHGAYATHEERRKGMLRPGLLGDVAVFDADLAAIAPLELDEVRVALTVVDGAVAYRLDA